MWHSQKKKKEKSVYGTSLVVKWLRFHASTAEGMGLIPVREPRYYMLCSLAKKKKLWMFVTAAKAH